MVTLSTAKDFLKNSFSRSFSSTVNRPLHNISVPILSISGTAMDSPRASVHFIKLNQFPRKRIKKPNSFHFRCFTSICICRFFVTARVRSTREGNVFSLSVSSHLGGGGTYLPDGVGGGTYSQVWMGGYLPSHVRVGGGVPTLRSGGGVPTFPGLGGGDTYLLGGGGGYLLRSGWGGTYLLGGGVPTQVWIGEYLPSGWGVPTQVWMGGYLPSGGGGVPTQVWMGGTYPPPG